MGQLLVVVHHTDTSPSLCYEPELIPDPVCWKWRWLSQPVTIACHKMLDLGSDQGYSIVQIDQLLMKGSAEISTEFHPELIPDPIV